MDAAQQARARRGQAGLLNLLLVTVLSVSASDSESAAWPRGGGRDRRLTRTRAGQARARRAGQKAATPPTLRVASASRPPGRAGAGHGLEVELRRRVYAAARRHSQFQVPRPAGQ